MALLIGPDQSSHPGAANHCGYARSICHMPVTLTSLKIYAHGASRNAYSCCSSFSSPYSGAAIVPEPDTGITPNDSVQSADRLRRLSLSHSIRLPFLQLRRLSLPRVRDEFPSIFSVLPGSRMILQLDPVVALPLPIIRLANSPITRVQLLPNVMASMVAEVFGCTNILEPSE